jgi:hypothetical protein
VAALSALSVMPGVVVGVFLSAYIERTRKRWTMVGADLMRALLLVVLPVTALVHALTMPVLCVVAVLSGALTSAFRIADVSYLPTLLPEDALIQANARFESTDAVAEAAGPAIAGFLIQVLGAPLSVLADALTYLWSAFLLSRIRHVEAPVELPVHGESIWFGVVSGFRACLAEPLTARLLTVEAISALSNGFFMALYMLIALRQMQLAPAVVGVVVAMGGVSSLAGALIAPAIGRRSNLLPILIGCLLVGQGADFLIAFAPSAGRFGLALLVLQQLLGDGLLTVYEIHAVSARQRLLDINTLARASGTFQVARGLAQPLGALLSAVVASVIGLQLAIGLAALIGMLGAVVLLPLLRRSAR